MVVSVGHGMAWLAPGAERPTGFEHTRRGGRRQGGDVVGGGGDQSAGGVAVTVEHLTAGRTDHERPDQDHADDQDQLDRHPPIAEDTPSGAEPEPEPGEQCGEASEECQKRG